MFKKQKSIIFYSHSLYIKQEKDSSKITLPLADPVLKEFKVRGYKICWIFREQSKLYNHKKRSYYTPLSSNLHGLAAKLDFINKLLNLINKFVRIH